MCKNIEGNSSYFLELDDLKPIRTIILEENGKVGVLLAEEELIPSSSVIRVYLINIVGEQYEIVKELDVYYFNTTEEALDFASRFETFSAIDLILFLNKEQALVTY